MPRLTRHFSRVSDLYPRIKVDDLVQLNQIIKNNQNELDSLTVEIKQFRNSLPESELYEEFQVVILITIVENLTKTVNEIGGQLAALEKSYSIQPVYHSPLLETKLSVFEDKRDSVIDLMKQLDGQYKQLRSASPDDTMRKAANNTRETLINLANQFISKLHNIQNQETTEAKRLKKQLDLKQATDIEIDLEIMNKVKSLVSKLHLETSL